MSKLNDLKTAYKEGDQFDQWNLCIGWLFAVADYLYWHYMSVPDHWEYRPGVAFHAGASESQEIDHIEPTEQDLIQFGEILYRLSEKLKSQGRNY